jgi:HAD superfamily phosphatase (TIGR01668 family)
MSILTRFTPDLIVSSIDEIPLDEMEAAGVRGFMFDLDNTLVEHYGEVATPEVVTWLGAARKRGFKFTMVTNAVPERAVPMAERLDMPCVHTARKPLRRGLRSGLRLLELPPDEVAMVGDQLFTDVWAGRRLGTYTIWVRVEEPEEPFLTAFKRPLERLLTAVVDVAPNVKRET